MAAFLPQGTWLLSLPLVHCCSHPTYVWDEGLVGSLRSELVKQRRMVSPDVAGAMSLLQASPGW